MIPDAQDNPTAKQILCHSVSQSRRIPSVVSPPFLRR